MKPKGSNVCYYWLEEALLRYKGPVLKDRGSFLDSGAILTASYEYTEELRCYENRVVLLQETSGASFLVLLTTLIRIGAYIAPISPNLTPEKQQKIADFLGAAALVTLRGQKLTIKSYVQLPPRPLPKSLGPGPGFIRFSSGTTGAAKGVCISQKAAVFRAKSSAAGLGLTSSDRMLWLLPMEYHFVAALFGALEAGVQIVVPESVSAEALNQEVETTFIYGAPADIRFLVILAPKISFPLLRLTVCTTARIGESETARFEKHFGVPVSRVLGAIEVGLGLGTTVKDSKYEESLGFPFPDCNVKLLHGEDLSVGLLAYKGKGLFSGYVNPLIEGESLLDQGWFITSDWAQLLDDNSYRIIGRASTSISSGGFKVFPEEVEGVLNDHPGVIESLVFGRDHSLAGAIVCAKVVVCENHKEKISEAILRKHCRLYLENYQVPQRVEFVEELPRTHTGKICRRT